MTISPMTITEEETRSPEVLETVKAGMRRHTESQVPWEEYQDVTILVRDADGRLIGAGLGETGRGWLHISVVWVDESARGGGVGSRIVRAMEGLAINRGCHAGYLNTFSYQARPFYEKLGYAVFGTLHNYPPGHQRFFMSKEL